MRPKTEALVRRNMAETYDHVDAWPSPLTTHVERKRDHYVARVSASHITGEVGRSLRRLSLIQARHEIKQFGARFDNIEQKFVDVADQIRLNAIYKKTFGGDAFASYDARTIMGLIASPEQMRHDRTPLTLEYGRTINTQAHAKILRLLNDKKMKTSLAMMKKDIRQALRRLNRHLLDVNQGECWRLHGDVVYTIANILKFYSTPERARGKSRVRAIEETDDRWAKLRPAYPKLERSHNGNMNRKRRPNQTGKTPKYLQRLLTDEGRRIFTRKSKALGGTVVIDISGSMNLSIDELEQLITSASGSTVWLYSATCQDIESENLWLVADNGRRVRQLPDGNGGNGVDLPALAYAYQQKRRRKDLMIWVSDGQVTGQRDECSRNLRRSTAKFIRSKNIHHVLRVNDAIKIMRDAQRGKRRARQVTNWEKQALTQMAR